MERIHADQADHHSAHHLDTVSESSTAPAMPGPSLPSRVGAVGLIELQRTIGNQNVIKLLARSSGRPRLDTPRSPVPARRFPAPQSARMIQRVIVDPDVQAVLTEEEVKFFQAEPDVAAAEGQLKKFMTDRQPRITFELGLIYEGKTLKRVIKGTAPSGTSGGTSSPAQVEITSEAVAKALGIPIPKPEDEASTFSEVVVTHNHPGGAPLSRGDVAMAVGRGMREMRAVGKFGTFAIARVKDTWGALTPDEVAAHFAKGEEKWKSACNEKLGAKKPMAPGPDIGKNFAADNFMAKHFACVSLKEAFPGLIDYAHPDEQVLIKARLNLYPIEGGESQESKVMTAATSFGFSAFGGQQKQKLALPGLKGAGNEM